MHRNALLALVAIIGTLLSTHLTTTDAVAGVRTFSAAGQHQGVLTFKVRGLDAQRVRSARVTLRGRRTLRVSLRRVRRAARSGVLRVRMARSWPRAERRARVRAAHHRNGHKLRVATDTTPPETSITSGPSGTVSSSSASFGFSSSESNSTFECRLDGASWAGCSSPKSYSALTNASHTFEVRAKDGAGNLDSTPAARSFTVQTGTTGSEPTPTPTPSPTPTAKATTRPVGSASLSDAEAAARVSRSSWEPRPENYTPNHRVPTSSELASFRSVNTAPAAYRDKVTGNFTGTTDEIIQWTAHKWGLDEDVVRAEAVQESWWKMSTNGDGGISYGLMQIKSTVVKGSFPLSRDSTAFNADYYGMTLRYYYDGAATWLNDACCFSGTTYRAGDLWGSVGAWFAGAWYATGANGYISAVKGRLNDRTWAQTGF